ncbi:unnamed protein product, partial [Amoebophrya sp. A25]
RSGHEDYEATDESGTTGVVYKCFNASTATSEHVLTSAVSYSNESTTGGSEGLGAGGAMSLCW